jgi:hypothetical protein
MRKFLFAAILSLVTAFCAQSQTLNGPVSSNITDGVYCQRPIITLSGGVVSYSFTVNYPAGADRNNITSGGAFLSITLGYGMGNTIYHVEMDHAGEDISIIPSGTVTYTGNFVLDQSCLDPIYTQYGDPVLGINYDAIYIKNGNQIGSYGYDEYYIQP